MADEKVLSEAGDESGFVRANVRRRLVPGKDFAAYYTNDTQVQTTPWDVRLMFGILADVDPEEGVATVERVADVRMSLQHAKKVAAILTEQLRQHEARIGYIAIPQD
jgi:hypothetical protein